MTIKRKILGRNITPGSEGVEYADDGITPIAFRVLRRGVNPTDKGDVVCTDESPSLIFDAFERRGMPLMIDYNHESCVPLEQRRVSTSEGWGVAAGRCVPEEREPDIWVNNVTWTSTALDRIHRRELTQISPVLGLNERNEVVELVSVALCFEGATHHGALLATRATTGRDASMPYQDLIDALEAALAAGDLDAARTAWAQLKDALTSATLSTTDEDTKAAMTALTASVEKLSRDVASVVAGKPTGAAGREDPTASAHLVELKRERARAVFTLNPGVVSADSERSYIQNADPEGAERLVREVRRNVALSRGNGPSGAKPPAAGGNQEPALPALSEAEKRMADKHKISHEEFARTKARQNERKALLGRGGAA